MKKRWLMILILTILLSASIFIGTIRFTAIRTILNPQWYSQMEHDIYYANRLAKEMNAEVRTILTTHEIQTTKFFNLFTSEEVENILNVRTNTVLKMTKENYLEKLIDLNEMTYALIELKTNDIMITLNEVNEELQEQLKNALGKQLIKIEDFEAYEKRINLFNVLVYACASPKAWFLMIFMFTIGVAGLINVYKFNKSKMVLTVGWSLVLTGFSVHVLTFLIEIIEEYTFFSYMTLNQELTKYAHSSILNLILIVAKVILLVGICLLWGTVMRREYRKFDFKNQ